MLTLCVNPSCKFEFNVESDQSVGTCPKCGQVQTFRSLEARQFLERHYLKLKSEKQLEHKTLNKYPAKRSVLLEDIRSLWNVGSIFRTADGAGFNHLYLAGITGSPPRKEIEKVSLGAESYLSWEYVSTSLDVLRSLKADGVCIIGLEYTSHSHLLTETLRSLKIMEPLCLVLGNEVNGILAETLELCDHVCHLPMRGIKTSLNVAVAFGIAGYLIADHITDHSTERIELNQ